MLIQVTILRANFVLALTQWFTVIYHSLAQPYLSAMCCCSLICRYFFQGALDLYNCYFLRVSRCIFEHNGPTSVIKQEQYRGHSGGLSVGYHAIPTSPMAIISECVFRNNTSDPTSDLVQTTSDLVRSSQFTGRGGGCAFPVNPLYSLNATVEDCLFEDNFANSFGGGLYVAFDGRESHILTLHRVKFLRNLAPTAGALEVGFVSGGNPGADNVLVAYDSIFIENHAVFGGGVYFFTLGICNTVVHWKVLKLIVFIGPFIVQSSTFVVILLFA